jgi:uncharacterized protein (TIGR02466 family)
MSEAIEWEDVDPGRALTAERAATALRAGFSRAPDRLDLRLKLASALYECDRMDEAADLLAPVIEAGEASAEANFLFGRAAFAAGRKESGLQALRAASETDSVAALTELSRALRASGDLDGALSAAQRALELEPGAVRAFLSLAHVLLARGETAPLSELCERFSPHSQRLSAIVAVKALAAALAGDWSETLRLADPERWVTEIEVDLPSDFESALAAELASHPALVTLPSTKATRGEGRRLNHVQSHGGPLAQQLLHRIRKAIADYVAAHPQLIALGYPGPDRCTLECWALISGPDAHEDWHIHPSGTISGVFYVTAPADPALEPRAGAIEFGPLPYSPEAESLTWPRRLIQPKPGRMLLFPSHLAHRTWPSAADAPRICVAFDAVATLDA